MPDFPKGDGIPFGDIEAISESFQDSQNEGTVILLATALTGSTLSIGSARTTLLKYRGFGEDSTFTDGVTERVTAFSADNIKSILKMLGLTQGGTKDEIKDRLIEYLRNPHKNVKVRKTAPKKEEKPAKTETKKTDKMRLNDGEESEDEEEVEEDGKKEKKKRAGKTPKKDPEAPKRPLSGYFHFGNEFRPIILEELKNEGKESGVTVVAKVISEKWNALDEEGKKKYMELAEQDKARYEKEMKVYESSGKKAEWDAQMKGAAAEDDKKKKAKKDPNAPKRAQTAYFAFGDEVRPVIMEELKNEGKSVAVTVVAKLISEKWNALDEEGRKKYQEIADQDKVRYEKEMKEYESSGKKSDWEKEQKKAAAAVPAKKGKADVVTAKAKKEDAGSKKPTEASLAKEIKRILSKQSETSSVSLKAIRKELETKFGCPLLDQKGVIEKLVQKQLDDDGN
ncbi:putative High mobility group protein DSP1 [Blattamonas nauphoetae]|uniref:High mobility group protein DSP1 n=1 Tax=Blattamonas nauphoetae TaxID=2049346 RepID=A0ABQ9YMI0_9EUKA|nr:putative High mobility group protein DSP1 [Blattamonas nauphoetae]